MKPFHIEIFVDVPDDVPVPTGLLTCEQIILILQHVIAREALKAKAEGKLH